MWENFMPVSYTDVTDDDEDDDNDDNDSTKNQTARCRKECTFLMDFLNIFFVLGSKIILQGSQ